MNQQTIKSLVDDFDQALHRIKYSSRHHVEMTKVSGRLLAYCQSKGIDQYSTETGRNFLHECFGYVFDPSSSLNRESYAVRMAAMTIRKINLFQHTHGLRKDRIPKLGDDDFSWALRDADFIREYIGRKVRGGVSARTLSECRDNIRRLYSFFDSIGLTSLKDISVEVIGSYWKSLLGYAPATCRTRAVVMKSLVSFGRSTGYISFAGDVLIPNIPRYERLRLPAVWRPEDVKRILKTCDRESPVGKRNYAIFLVVAELGLRASDINNLTLANLDFNRREISVTQHKTQSVRAWPMSDEVGWALIDYIRNGRPQGDAPYVFLSGNPPHGRMGDKAASSALEKACAKCGIHQDHAISNTGLHSLRHALATKLLEKNIPLETISDIMGHASTSSTSPYLRIDMDALRGCALSMGEVEHV